ncbi:PREDICTED: probable ATP synthase 24 kDa subunit, mitochondrial [Ipomoea nil]|uniref:probable ATP synthase 24 kDa subunit, mitochondrial n=1 Tax=Ipomoea nil TaxID=35883 RepID=UPI0009011365|nr:PREDICTED: probable ATP synthase 24 kDa subunit, mitochondrial [Ipomoea nil]
MAFASRFLSRSSRQLCSSQIITRPDSAIPIRSFAKGAGAPAALKGDEMLKNVFLEVKKKFETAIGVLRKEKITIDPEDTAAVTQYAKVMKTVREKANLQSESEKIKEAIDTQTNEIPDARTYLLTLKEIRIKSGLPDEHGIEEKMMNALDKVEKELKKPLLRNDKKGIALLTAEFDKINQKIGISRENLPKYEEQLEMKVAKAQLEELKKDALEAMETQKKREEFNDEEMPEVKSLDIRNFL